MPHEEIRTLLTFAEIGIIDLVEGYREPKRFDTNIEKYHHFRYLNCNKVIDIYDNSAPWQSDNSCLRYRQKNNLFKSKAVLEGIRG